MTSIPISVRVMRLTVVRLWVCALALACLPLLASAQSSNLPMPGAAGSGTASGPVRVSPPSDLTAQSYILVDFESGLSLAERDPQFAREPASLTKLLTAYVVFNELKAGRLSMEEEVLVSERAWRTGMSGASRMFIEVGQRVTVADLLRGMIVQSGNDASTALAERIAGSEAAFVDLMNRTALEIGMSQSYFTNPHGLPSDEQQFTTALDMAQLARTLILEHPELYRIYSEKSFRFADINQSNRNILLWRDETFDGLKTGWTSSAGYNLVSSAERDGRRLIAVVMGIDAANHQQGGTIRANESQALVNWGFRFTRTRKLFDAGTVLEEPRVYMGDASTFRAGLARSLWVVVPPGEGDNLSAELDLRGFFEAPLAAGDRVGEVIVTLDGESVSRAPVVALDPVEPGGWIGSGWDRLVLAIRGILPW